MMSALSLFFTIGVIFPSVLTEAIFNTNPPEPFHFPCELQTDSEYFKLMQQCISSENTKWIIIDSDPDNCEGYCESATTTTTTTTTTVAPCDQQTDSNYYAKMVECTQNSENPGEWIISDSDPWNCRGYCEPASTTTETITTPFIPCEEQTDGEYYQLKRDCYENHVVSHWNPTNSDPLNCEGYCSFSTTTAPCDQQTDSEYYRSMIDCLENWVVTDSDRQNCQGYCGTHTTTTETTTAAVIPCEEQTDGEYYEFKKQCILFGYKFYRTEDDSDPLNCHGVCTGYGYPDCDFEIDNDYYRPMIECTGNSDNLGTWIRTSSYSCEGYCEYLTTTAPCDEEIDSDYYRSKIECTENSDYFGTWIHTNSYPCEGYCEYLTTTAPCDQQIYSDYYRSMLYCAEESKGRWITSNSDPQDCQGYCEDNLTTPDLSLPCDQQVNSEYYESKLECLNTEGREWYSSDSDPKNCIGYCLFSEKGCEWTSTYRESKRECMENSENPGVWIPTNEHWPTCEGYCKVPTTTTTLPPTTTTTLSLSICDIPNLKESCVNQGSGCILNIINLESCQAECVCPDCGETFEKIKLACENQTNDGNKCFFEVSDSFSCQGNCICKKSSEKKLKCKPVVT